jgi:cystathionine beta-lyase
VSDATDPFGLRTLDVEALRSKRGAKWMAYPNRYSAWVADMDFPVAPAIIDALHEVIDGNEFGYPAWGGPYALSPAAKLFAPRMAERYGWEPQFDRVHDVVDVIQGVRSTVLVAVVQREGAFDYDALEAELEATGARMWILCHPQNPLGHVFERPELERIADIAMRFDLTVISDEIHSDLTMPGAGHIPFESLGPEVSARTVTVTSASKAFNLAGLRWAVLHAGSAAANQALRALPGHYLGAPNLMAVTATVAAWTRGADWLDAVIGVLDENRHALSGLIEQHLPGVRYRPPDATYLAWLDCRELGLVDPHATFRERGVELSPGPQFGPPGEGHVRINIATSPAILADAVAALAG